jgi:hypothetical protein
MAKIAIVLKACPYYISASNQIKKNSDCHYCEGLKLRILLLKKIGCGCKGYCEFNKAILLQANLLWTIKKIMNQWDSHF